MPSSIALQSNSPGECDDFYNNAPCGYHSLDKDGTVIRINNTSLAWLGYTRDEVVGKVKWTELVSPASQQVFRENFPRFLQRGVIRDLEMEIVRKDGTAFIGLVNATAIYDADGNFVMSRSTVIDITERKRLEREVQERRDEMETLQKLHVASMTAAAIAHELNQPLLAIASYSEAALMLLQAGEPNLDKVRKALEGSKLQARRAGKSIRELLDFLSLKEFPVEDLDFGQEMLAILDAVRSEHEVPFRSELKLEEPSLIRGNRTHIQKALSNLLSNAIEAMQQAAVPQPEIAVTLCRPKGERVAQITIADNGPGIRKEDVRRLFEPFFTTKTSGLGMGLAISRSLIEANGGQLWIDPQEGSGAIFHVTLPLAI